MKNIAPNTYSDFIKTEAKRLGFLSCGISKAGFLEKEAPVLEKWLKQKMNGEMAYMENNFDKRLNPTLLVDGAKSVVSLGMNYFHSEHQSENSYKVAKYAYGKDYHIVLKQKLNELLASIRDNIGEVSGRAFVDSAPVLERAWASRAGLGWIGKNSNLIAKGHGSFFFLAELIIDLDLAQDPPTTNHCGNCRACIDHCPTSAITAPAVVDASKCISYFTIELKENISTDVKGKLGDWIFGCDVCQDVCPWNRFAEPNERPLSETYPEILSMSKKDWEEITEDVFNGVFKDSPLKRTKWKGLKRNIDFVKL